MKESNEMFVALLDVGGMQKRPNSTTRCFSMRTAIQIIKMNWLAKLFL